MAQGTTSKRARQRLRGKQRSEARLQAARQACRSYPMRALRPLLATVPDPTAAWVQRANCLPASDPGAEPGRRAAATTALALAPRRAPVTGRVRLALADGSISPRKPLARTSAPRAPSLAAVLVTPPVLLDSAAILRRRQVAANAERRRSIAAMLAATLALGSLIALDPFATDRGRTAGPQVAVVAPATLDRTVTPEASDALPARPRPAVPEAGVEAVPKSEPADAAMARQWAALPEIRMPAPPLGSHLPSWVAEAPSVTLADPPDGYLSEAPRVAAPRIAVLPKDDIAAAPAAPPPAEVVASPSTNDGGGMVARAPESPAHSLPGANVASLPAERIDPPMATTMVPPAAALPPPATAADMDGDDDADEGFDRKLVLAAHELTKIPGGYDPRYMKIAYPMGDVPEGMGVCSDVIVRAYRGIGIDLQPLVHQSRLGTGDTNVDHRRVQVLIRFFARHGSSLPISPFPESYKPGDIVAYDVPWGRTSKWHIAIVTDQISPSLRPMVVHNRGYGAKLEDALFHKRIIGHFRIDARTLMALGKPAPTASTTAIVGKPNRRAMTRLSAPRS